MTTMRLPNGVVVRVTDWIDDRVYSTIGIKSAAARPQRTYCHRRWPDVVIYTAHARAVGDYVASICTAATLVDADLCDVVAAAYRAFEANGTVNAGWLVARSFRSLAPRPPVRWQRRDTRSGGWD